MASPAPAASPDPQPSAGTSLAAFDGTAVSAPRLPSARARLTEPAGVWRSHLVSRAAENQRYVLAANAAHPDQHCPGMVVSPRGEVLAELPPGATDRIRTTIDLAEVSEWYLRQRRRDVIDLRYQPESVARQF